MRLTDLCATGVVLFLVVNAGDHPAEKVSAQDTTIVLHGVAYPQRIDWSTYDPYLAVTSRVYAQAELIHAQGDAAVTFAQARNLHAEAYSQELDNWMKELRTYWDRKITVEQKRVELSHARQIRRLQFLNDRKWENSRTWDQLKNHPELRRSSIANGQALNFLLHRLGASVLPYEFDESVSRFGPEAIEQLRLDEELLGHVMLKRGSYVFPANQAAQEQTLFWPYLLRWADFDGGRNAYEVARKRVVDESEANGDVSVQSIQQLQRALVELSNRFHRSKRIKEWVAEHLRYSQFRSSDRFLWKLDREIARLEETGDIRPFQGRSGYDPQTDGDHVLSLLCFMNRNGLEFAAAQPGSEFAHHHLFVLMRSVYLTVDEQDESIRPEDLRVVE